AWFSRACALPAGPSSFTVLARPSARRRSVSAICGLESPSSRMSSEGVLRFLRGLPPSDLRFFAIVVPPQDVLSERRSDRPLSSYENPRRACDPGVGSERLQGVLGLWRAPPAAHAQIGCNHGGGVVAAQPRDVAARMRRATAQVEAGDSGPIAAG